MSEKNYFQQLNEINVSDKTEKKNGLTYLSWAWAWAEVKKLFPDANYTVYENKDGWFYHTDGKTCWVKTGVTVNGVEHIEFLPVMDFKNKSIPADKVTSFDVNKAIQRSLTKAVARHGLGLYIYAGEDLPEGEEPQKNSKPKFPPAENIPAPIYCTHCNKTITAHKAGGKVYGPAEIAERSEAKYGAVMCWDCMVAANEGGKQ